MRDGVVSAWKEQDSVRESYSLARPCVLALGDFFRPPSIANVYHAGYSCVRVL